ncbi:hypothetical protein O181_114246 [Austropuccinia psidii MF-1]|uniref:Uncharacterized protein n=1 Tax=Austropuccinia psidii MF-1 TaxID=1389203 RepID=A0A9Q3K5V8_9BASI|nr:hypothetical protein [Austropuccinia psidii MF-1]
MTDSYGGVIPVNDSTPHHMQPFKKKMELRKQAKKWAEALHQRKKMVRFQNTEETAIISSTSRNVKTKKAKGFVHSGTHQDHPLQVQLGWWI